MMVAIEEHYPLGSAGFRPAQVLGSVGWLADQYAPVRSDRASSGRGSRDGHDS